ncbi:MAG: SDR family NAD(P)-dependent oxidoreductase [Myxococcales bacterium]|nr:SDR family NAD(P)-dependent oxidoreductase [Myxococcales bacterium]
MTFHTTSAEPIAIIGLGCRYPDARNPRELWENILARRQSFRRIPEERLPLSEYGDSDKTAPDKTYATRAAVIDGFEFDWARRRIPKQVYEQTDITHWLALDVALQALADAGYEAKDLPRDRTGVIIGNTLTGEQQRAHLLRGRWPFVRKTIRAAGLKKGLDGATLEELVAETEQIYKSFFPAPNEDTLAGALANTIAGRICNYLDLRGGGYTVDGACASSLLSVATAANALCAGDIDLAFAGGVDVSLDAFELVGFARVGALSDSDMKVYDRAGNGFLPGEGCGFIMMKRLSDAKRDGDYIYATLNGWGVSSDGKGGMTAPTVDGQALALRRAYDRAGYSAHQLDFVEGHGTGTAVGDPVELTAISNTIDSFGEALPHGCGVTSFKSLVGHTKAAAGIGGLLKAIAGVNRRVIPPTVGCDDPHEVFTTNAKNLYPVRTGSVRDASRVLTAGVSAMGFGGINSHVTVTSGAPPSLDLAPSLDERALLATKQETELFILAEDSLAALEQRANRLLEVAAGMSIGEMPDLAVELARTARRDCTARAAIVASSPEDLCKRLSSLLSAIANGDSAEDFAFSTPDRRLMLTVGAASPRVGFLFPGQGSQRLNMARTLVERFDWARELVARADRWLEEIGVGPVSPFIFRETDPDLSGDQQREWMRTLTETQVAQPAICLASLLWLRYMEHLEVRPEAVGGHSLGELTAFHAAGVLDEKSVIQLAGLRGKLMGEVSVEGSMASLVCDPDHALDLINQIDGYVVIANINSPAQTVVSGDSAAVAAMVELATKNGIRARELPVSAAFHSSHFNQTVAALRDTPVLRGTAEPTKARLYSTMTGTVLEGEIDLAAHFGEQVIRPVNFAAVARLAASECDVLVEVGPGAVLSGLTDETAGAGGTPCLPVESKAGRDRDLNIALGQLFARGVDMDLLQHWDRRLIRRFRSAAELSFIQNPCEKDLLDPAVREHAASEVGAELNRMPVSTVRAVAPKSSPKSHDVSARVSSSTPPYVDVRAVLLDTIHRQTGFPADSLTDDLRMIDDLHMDSIKTVQVVVDVAVAVGYAGDFDPADIANATLAEIVLELEGRIATANEGRSGSLSPTRAAEIGKNYPGWTRNFVMRWQDAPLPEPARDFWQGQSVCLLDDGSTMATDLWEAARKKGAEVTAVPAAATADLNSNIIIAVLSDAAMGTDAQVRFDNVTDLLASIAKGLPLSTSSESPQTVVFVQRRTSQSNDLDWGYDGFVAALHLERKSLRFRVMTVDEAVDCDRLCAMIAGEVGTDIRYDAARYFGNTRRIARPKILPRNALTARAKQLCASDVVLVTGGARGITAECALALGRETGAHMVLAGSSPTPVDAPESPNSAEIVKTLARFADEGLSAEYRQCDLSERDEVTRLVSIARRRTGHVAAVIHGAAINRPRRAHTVTAEEARQEISPKLLGALHLFEALKDDPPAVFCALTSVIGVTGMPNNAWYAFANQGLDRSLGMFAASNPGTDAISMAFSVWDEVGMGANLGSLEGLASLGTDSIPLEEGVGRFLELFKEDAGDRQVIVTGRLGGIDTWRPEFPALPKGTRFLEDVRFFQPGVEVVARSHLSLGRDAYLTDHNYKDVYLFPTVFGLEAMAQTVAYALGRHELGSVTLSDVDLSRPLPVHPERGLDIEVYARVLEDLSGSTTVKTGIRCEQNGFSVDHFSCTFALGVQVAPAEQADLGDTEGRTILPLDPQRDLYGPILFQGPRFQRIRRLQQLDSLTCRFESEEREHDEFVLGDPFARDALLQSLQLCALPDQCLPIHIGRWQITDTDKSIPRARCDKATITNKTEVEYVGNIVSTTHEGIVLEALSDYRAKILDHRQDWPTAGELAGAGRRAAESIGQTEWSATNCFYTIDGGGPRGQVIFAFRFPLTFRSSANPLRTVYFSNFAEWMGKARELSGMLQADFHRRLFETFGAGLYGGVTNSFETTILGRAGLSDVIEGRIWMEDCSDTEYSATCEWRRIPFTAGQSERIAMTRMQTSSVEIVGHGLARPAPWPEDFYEFLVGMRPSRSAAAPLDVLPEALAHLQIGTPIWTAKNGGDEKILAKELFSTSLQDSNLVGNLYFGNYSDWQGRLRDKFLHDIAPSCFDPEILGGQIECLHFATHHLREAMPFDNIEASMYLRALHSGAMDLWFEYHRVDTKGTREKLAVGEHRLALVSAEGEPLKLIQWPSAVLSRLERIVGEHRGSSKVREAG